MDQALSEAPAWVHGNFLSKQKPANKSELFYPLGNKCASYNDKDKQFAWISRAKQSVKARLRDPGSAKFQNSFFSCGEGGIPLVCGQVNAKNGFGGFTGFENYISAGRSDLTFLQNEVEDFSILWKKMCARPGVIIKY